MYSKIILKPGKEASLLRFHPWVFSGAIAGLAEPSAGPVQEGDKVLVMSHQGQVLGVGHAQAGSIAVRMLSFSDEPVDLSFYGKRIGQALRLRETLGLFRKGNDTFRLVHGEGDFLPGLIVDVYKDTAVLQAHSAGMHLDRELLAQALLQQCGHFLKRVYYKSENTLPHKESLGAIDGYIAGKAPARKPVACENGLKFHPDWEEGQKTGFFIDQRENRALVERYARGKRVLNMFCYTGGFSLYALRGGALEVDSVDSSAKAVALTEANVRLNFGTSAPHRALEAEAFGFLRSADETYDLMILDPPAFAKHQRVLPQALQGYRKLNALALKKIAPNGVLFTFSCSQAVSREDFRLSVVSAAVQSGRKVRILHQLCQPADHPVNSFHPEGEYLKGLVLFVE